MSYSNKVYDFKMRLYFIVITTILANSFVFSQQIKDILSSSKTEWMAQAKFLREKQKGKNMDLIMDQYLP